MGNYDKESGMKCGICTKLGSARVIRTVMERPTVKKLRPTRFGHLRPDA